MEDIQEINGRFTGKNGRYIGNKWKIYRENNRRYTGHKWKIYRKKWKKYRENGRNTGKMEEIPGKWKKYQECPRTHTISQYFDPQK